MIGISIRDFENVLIRQLNRWAESVRDYEVLRRQLPNNNEIAESLFHAQVALKKSTDFN